MAAQREWFEKDYYKVLGVVPTATDKEITRAYRKLAKEHHPDTNPGSEERFKEITEAYNVLSDDKQRKEYDDARSMFGSGFRVPGGSRTGSGGGRRSQCVGGLCVRVVAVTQVAAGPRGLDVLSDGAQRCPAAGAGEVGAGPEDRAHGSVADPVGVLGAQVA